MSWRILPGDVRDVLKTLPDASVQCVVTSPPYWGLRDYGTGTWEGGSTTCPHVEVQPQGRDGRETPGGRGGSFPQSQRAFRSECLKCGALRIDRQIGLESTPDAFVAEMVAVFGEVRRVLKADGVCWLNLGDSYNAYNGGAGPGSKLSKTQTEQRPQLVTGYGLQDKSLKPKDLIGIPWRVAFALQADGWYLRSDIIWHKPNPMPESIQDRPTKAHEYVFLLSKSQRYYYDADAIRQPYAESTMADFGADYESHGLKDYASAGVQNPSDVKKRIKDKQRYKAAQIAGQSPHGYTKRDDGLTSMAPLGGANCRSVWTIATQPYADAHFATFPEALPERCIKAGSRPGDVVLDPFCGAGTTLMVGLGLHRDVIGVELNPEYVKLAERRIVREYGLFAETMRVTPAAESFRSLRDAPEGEQHGQEAIGSQSRRSLYPDPDGELHDLEALARE